MTLLCLTTRGWCGIGRSRSRSTSAPRDLYRAVPLSRRSPGVDFARLLARDCVCRGDSRCPGARVRCGRFLKVSKTAQNSILYYQHRTARRDRFISTSYLATTGQHSRCGRSGLSTDPLLERPKRKTAKGKSLVPLISRLSTLARAHGHTTGSEGGGRGARAMGAAGRGGARLSKTRPVRGRPESGDRKRRVCVPAPFGVLGVHKV